MKTLAGGNGSGLDVRNPMSEVQRLFQEFDNLFDRPGLWNGAFTPLADIEETDDAFVIEVELPGINRKDASVEIQGRRVVVSGERKERERKGILRRKTRVTGRFRFEVLLPEDIDADKVTATYEDGVLLLRVPKTELAGTTARKIEIH